MAGQNNALEVNRMSRIERMKAELDSLKPFKRSELLSTVAAAIFVAALAILLDGAYVLAFGLVPMFALKYILEQIGATKNGTPLLWAVGQFASVAMVFLALFVYMAVLTLKMDLL